MLELYFILGFAYFVAGIGILFSVFSLLILFHHSLLHNAFGLICGIQSIANAVLLILTVFVIFSMALINPNTVDGKGMEIICYFTSFLHFTVLYLQVIKSINRLSAILLPAIYRSLFTVKNATKLLLVIIISSLLFTILYLQLSCPYSFSTKTYSFSFKSGNGCGTYLIFALNMYFKPSLLIVSLFCDLITLYFLIKFHKKFASRSQKSKEIGFFFQTFLTSIFWAGLVIFPLILRPYTTTMFMQFFTGLGFMLIFHMMNEVLFVSVSIKFYKSMKVTPHITPIPAKMVNIR